VDLRRDINPPDSVHHCNLVCLDSLAVSQEEMVASMASLWATT
jgi:hypothetical protein